MLIKAREIQVGSFHQQPDCLSYIQRTAATNCDSTVAPPAPERIRALTHVLFYGVRMHTGIQKPFRSLTLCAECLAQRSERRCVDKSVVGNDQRPRDPK